MPLTNFTPQHTSKQEMKASFPQFFLQLACCTAGGSVAWYSWGLYSKLPFIHFLTLDK